MHDDGIEASISKCALEGFDEAKGSIENLLFILLFKNYQTNKDRVEDIGIIEKIYDRFMRSYADES